MRCCARCKSPYGCGNGDCRCHKAMLRASVVEMTPEEAEAQRWREQVVADLASAWDRAFRPSNDSSEGETMNGDAS